MKVIVIKPETEKRVYWIAQVGASIRHFETETEAWGHASWVAALTGIMPQVYPVEY